MERATVLFDGRGDKRWAASLRRFLGAIKDEDFSGVQNFLEAFGGMGSINDLGTGDKVLEQTLSRAFVIAGEIRRERFADGGWLHRFAAARRVLENHR